MLAWVDMFNRCHTRTPDGLLRLEWPNGGAYNDQENIVVVMFLLLEGVVNSLQKEVNK